MTENTSCPECKSENIDGTSMHKSKIDIETGRRWGELKWFFECKDCGYDWEVREY